MTAERSSRAFELVTANGVRWHVAPEFRDRLFGDAGLLRGHDVHTPGLPAGWPLDAWLREGQAVVIKHGPHRTVYRLRLGGLDLFLQHNRVHNARALLRQLIRPSKSRMECDSAREAARRGVATIAPLAYGETGRLWPGDSFLITETLPDVEPLDTFLEKTLLSFATERQHRLRLTMATVLGEFVARMHDAGVWHHDLHAGNMLVRLTDDRPSLFLIDLHASKLGSSLTWEASRDNLIVLGRWFTIRCSRHERWRFWQVYHKTRNQWGGGQPDPTAERLAREVEEKAWRSNLSFWRSRDDRCLVSNRYYQRVKRGAVCGHAVRDLDHDALNVLLRDPDEPFQRDGMELLKDSRSSTVVELTINVNGVPRAVIYKRFRVTSWSDPWLSLVRQTGAMRSWIMGQGLRERCLPSPRPLAVFHRLDHGRPAEGYLLVEKVESACDLKEFVDELEQRPLTDRLPIKRQAIERLASLVRELHRRRLSHRDLKASNILVARDETEQPKFWLIDLVGVRRHRELGQLRMVRNLTRLHVSFHRDPAISRTDKLRFLRVYLQWGLFGRKRWKEWWRQVEQATLTKTARNLRVGRPLT
jgi:tRNA A-37 threonylcarbamoyl transferase component Bud32